MTAPQTPFRYPARTRLVVVAVLALALAGFALAVVTADTDGDDSGVEVSGDQAEGGIPRSGGDPIVRVQPPRGAPVALAQETIMLQLEPGWLAELVLEPEGGRPIPLPESEIRHTDLNQFIYRVDRDPDEERAVERLPSGRNCVRYTIWDQVRGREASERTGSWCFSVT